MRTAAMGLAALAAFALAAKVTFAQPYDPKAATLLADLLAKYQFTPKASFHSTYPWQFSLTERPENASLIEARAAELFGKLKSADYRFLAPIERSDEISKLKLYLSLKPACAGHPISFWNISTGVQVSQRELERFTEKSLPRVLVPYAPGLPRPVDYEIAYVNGKMVVAPATEGFALYRLPQISANGSSDSIYILRAEEFFVPGKSGIAAKEDGPAWGILAAFGYPSCTFHGSLDYSDSCAAFEQGRFRDQYIAELVEIDRHPLALTVTTLHCANDIAGSQYVITLWDVGLNDDKGGVKYTLVQRK